MTTTRALRSLGIGAATGMRTMAGPRAAFRGRTWGGIAVALSIGEMIVDKLPQTPARTLPIGLIARGVSAGISAAALTEESGDRPLAAILGAGAAIGMAYAGVAYRAAASRYLPPFACAALEDAAAVALAAAAARRS
jgi:uncharacterized membrane protein